MPNNFYINKKYGYFLNKKTYLIIGVISIGFIEFLLESYNLSILGLNAGAGCLIPVIGYAFLGNLWYKIKIKYIHLSIIPIALMISLNVNFRYDVEYLIYDIIQKKYINFSNWNHSLYGFIFNSLLIMTLFKLINNKNLHLNLINTLGKNSLSVYVFHLLVIALFYYNSWGLSNPTETFLFIVFLLISSNYLVKLKRVIF